MIPGDGAAWDVLLRAAKAHDGSTCPTCKGTRHLARLDRGVETIYVLICRCLTHSPEARSMPPAPPET